MCEGIDRPGLRPSPTGSGDTKMNETGCEAVCGAPKTPHGKGIDKEGEEGEEAIQTCILFYPMVK